MIEWGEGVLIPRRGGVEGGRGSKKKKKRKKECSLLVTSTSNTDNLLFSTPSRPSNNRAFVPSKSRLAVATIGREVFCKRRRVSEKPIPREAGVVRIQPAIFFFFCLMLCIRGVCVFLEEEEEKKGDVEMRRARIDNL